MVQMQYMETLPSKLNAIEMAFVSFNIGLEKDLFWICRMTMGAYWGYL